MSKEVIIEEPYNTIKSFFEKHNIGNGVLGILQFDYSNVRLIIGKLKPKSDKSCVNGKLFIEDENKLIFRYNKKTTYNHINYYIHFKQISNIFIHIEEGKEVLGIEYFLIEPSLTELCLIYAT